ncbi:MAG TPA: o-succinylbenzoate synthase, partial [Kiloniellales bacterium]|nr:o-succinylbenzoate synthase [Kiloniellales bacterium]
MRVEAVELFHVRMPMKEVWRTAFSEESAIESIFVRMVIDGQEGWGETAPYRSPQYSSEWCDGAFSLLHDWLAPAIIGREIASGEALAALIAPFKGNQFAKAGLDLAWWDAHARLEGQPLWQLIGGTDNRVEVGADIAVLSDIDALLTEIAKAQEVGFKRTKLKFRPGWDVGMVRSVREAFPDAVIHVDCNSGFTLDDLPLFRELDRFGLAMIEQPLGSDDLVDHARLQADLETPICLDESITSLDRARKAIEVEACRWINLKVGRAGGLTNAIAIHNF